ncbi:hypothetical protein PV02_00145 [Methanolobus chelungpuianus]|uniref:Uncharacterized protein n=1 Tax=Methanolobus chelungpuianus TaxID=502115 RepID=A0AAE3H8R2_9EURY|nr:hypothetical protein [Methanolobus chelungpuianus]
MKYPSARNTVLTIPDHDVNITHSGASSGENYKGNGSPGNKDDYPSIKTAFKINGLSDPGQEIVRKTCNVNSFIEVDILEYDFQH